MEPESSLPSRTECEKNARRFPCGQRAADCRPRGSCSHAARHAQVDSRASGVIDEAFGPTVLITGSSSGVQPGRVQPEPGLCASRSDRSHLPRLSSRSKSVPSVPAPAVAVSQSDFLRHRRIICLRRGVMVVPRAGAGLHGQGFAGFPVLLRQRGILCVRWGGEVLLFSGSSSLAVGWGVMAGAEGRCWATRSGRCRVFDWPAPLRHYLMFEGWGGELLLFWKRRFRH
jgi:hypothetical protein